MYSPRTLRIKWPVEVLLTVEGATFVCQSVGEQDWSLMRRSLACSHHMYTSTGRTIEEAMTRLEAEAEELNLSMPHSFHHTFAHERDSFPGTARTKGGSLGGTDDASSNLIVIRFHKQLLDL